jgi:hypothetical protein
MMLRYAKNITYGMVRLTDQTTGYLILSNNITQSTKLQPIHYQDQTQQLNTAQSFHMKNDVIKSITGQHLTRNTHNTHNTKPNYPAG